MGVCRVGEGDWIKKDVENLEERQAKKVEEVQAEDDQDWDYKDLKNQTQQDMTQDQQERQPNESQNQRKQDLIQDLEEIQGKGQVQRYEEIDGLDQEQKEDKNQMKQDQIQVRFRGRDNDSKTSKNHIEA